MVKKRKNIGYCHQWIKDGNCKFGEICRFDHPEKSKLSNSELIGDSNGNIYSETQASSTIPLYFPSSIDKVSNFCEKSNSDQSAIEIGECTLEESQNQHPNGVSRPRTFTDRSFVRLYMLNVNSHDNRECGNRAEDLMLLLHFNGLKVLALAPSHPAKTDGNGKAHENSHITKVRFCEFNGVSLANLIVSGKKKHGSVFVEKGQLICELCCCDGMVYKIRACAPGKIVEVNRQLEENPGLLIREDSFIVIQDVVSGKKRSRGFEGTMTQEDYLNALRQRKEDQSRANSEFHFGGVSQKICDSNTG